jgi:hypothetical protein
VGLFVAGVEVAEVEFREELCEPKNPLPGLFALDEERACAAMNDTNEESEHSNITERLSKIAPRIIRRLGLINK